MINKRLISLTICWILVTVPGLCVLSFAGNESATNTEAEQHFEKANEFHKLADYDAAITEYKAVISLSPKNAIAQNAQYWIGQIYFETRQFDDALSTFQELVDEFPSSVVVPTTKAMIERVQQAKKNKSLFEAVKKENIEKVRLLIAEGADLDAKWGDINTKEKTADTTPLFYSVNSNNMDLVKLLVEAGADVNAGRQWPPLCQAVYANNTAIAEYLIDHGANVNYPEEMGPLQTAPYYSNNIEMVKLLIARGADINGGIVGTALHRTIWMERKDIFELLIQHGANVNVKDKWGFTPLSYAIFRDDYLYFMNIMIANGADVNTKDLEGETYLHSAATAGRTEAVKLLLEAGANINTKSDRGQTALHAMLDIRNSDYNKYRLSKDTVELLLANGAGMLYGLAKRM